MENIIDRWEMQLIASNQIYLVTFSVTELIQASFLQKNQMLQMFFDIFTPEIPVSSKI